MMPSIRIHQFHSGSAVGDAVTNGMFLIQDALSKRGVNSDIYVEGRDPRLADRLKLLGELRPDPDDLLLIHHSMGHDVMPFIDAINCRKILIYHNITPPKYFETGRRWQDYAARGYQQLHSLRPSIIAAVTDSPYNTQELERRGFETVATIPMLRDFKACARAPFNQHLQHHDEPGYHLLFVGRVVGNKGQAELVEFMAAYADSFEHPLHLTLIGHADHGDGGYVTQVSDAIRRHGLEDRITLAGSVSNEDLYGYYRASDAYVSLSRHEGFGVPIVEAMAFDLPVVALDSSAVSSTLGNSGVLIPDSRPDTIAKALAPILTSRRERRRIVTGQRQRLDDFDVDKLSDAFCDFLSPYLPQGVKLSAKSRTAVLPPARKPRRRFVVEGPCETTYSLALTNRSLAFALDDLAGSTATLFPMEGHGNYRFDEAEAAYLPRLDAMLKPPPATAGETIVSIRNTYPTRPAGMMGDLRLLYFFWEETEAPRKVIDLMERHLDGVVVASEFGRTLLRNSGLSLPIGLIGHGVDHRELPRALPDQAPKPDRPFRFLHISSGLARKGIEELFLAYVTAFTAGDNVELVIKTYDNETNVIRPLFDAMIAGRSNAPTVHVIASSSMLDLDMQSLYQQADAVVLPSRGEGFNIPAAEAMAAGTPVIVTGFSAHMDFCSEDTAWIIDFDFEPSGSHVRSVNSNWVKAHPMELAAIMRKLYTQTSATKALRDRKKRAAFKTASSLTWAKTAQKTESFVDSLMADTPSKPKLRIAWISTWNTKCGIASYSEFLTAALGSAETDVTVFANREVPNSPDGPDVVRAWNMSTAIDDLAEQIVAGGFDAVVVQYNFGFFSLEALASALARLRAASVDTYVFFHKTESSVVHGREVSLANIASTLKGVTRLVVHTADDVNRLKAYGLIDNVAQIPHGFPAAPAYDQKLVKRFLGMRDAYPLIASYGFLLPHKGITELIVAFGLLRTEYPDARLLLLNGEYPAPVSAEEAKLCRDLIADLGLSDHIVLVTDYMANDDVVLMLHAADVVVYPYQDTGESASGAVRLGLSALRPVAVTPLRIFKDVSDYVYTLPGTTAPEMAKGLSTLMKDEALRTGLMSKQRAWLGDVNWDQIGKRLTGMMVGLYNDTHQTKITPVMAAPEPAQVTDRPGSEAVLDQLSPIPFVRLACQRILGRDPLAAELSMAGEIEQGLATRDQIVSRLTAVAQQAPDESMASADDVISFDDIASDANEQFVRALYMRLLGREGDESGFSLHLSRLTSGQAKRSDLVRDFVESDEFLSNDRVITVIGADAPSAEAAPSPVRRAKG